MPEPERRNPYGRIVDISPAISAATAVWPGDAPFQRTEPHSLERGDTISLDVVTTTLHLGAHVDAPSHFARGAASVEQLPLAAFIGPAVVIDAPVLRDGSIAPISPEAIVAPRVLVRTGSWTDRTRFPEHFAALNEAHVALLAASGVILLGIDLPSVDPADSKELPNHHKLFSAGIAILEQVDLQMAPAGEYTLVALPLNICGATASPVRAVLLKAL
ncbi:MAG: cyclase family protein [Armatimonadetes bacterium]|nr:cyclase family protein [Armatimonadota bacterium]MDE2207974.1 cyclase family protein [Armatimonadota bacterium]